jgi:protein-ribulosamine 3-kinase
MVLLKGRHYKRVQGLAQLLQDENIGGGNWRIANMWQAIEQGISSALGETFRVLDTRPASGGCINEAIHLLGKNQSFFVKLNSVEMLGMFEAEATGLAAIRASDTLRAPNPVACGVSGGKSWLALEYIAFGAQRPAASVRLGALLAEMHRSTADAFGWERNNTIGSTPQLNPWTEDWVSFLQDYRIGSQLTLACGNGLPSNTIASAEKLLEALPALFTHYHPEPALLHGDLWGGNWATDTRGLPVIFDPAVYFGDRETDLAMTELFGGFDTDFYRAYDAAWPLDPGYQTRKQLYQLYHVLNHFNLFGASYAGQAGTLIDRLLAQMT